MKSRLLAVTVGLAIALAASVASAKTLSPQVLSIKAALKATPAVEMPAKAAQIVAKANAKEQKQTALDVIEAAYSLSPASLSAIVSAVCRVSPALAKAVAEKASALAPMQARSFMKISNEAIAQQVSPAAVTPTELPPVVSDSDNQTIITRIMTAPVEGGVGRDYSR